MRIFVGVLASTLMALAQSPHVGDTKKQVIQSLGKPQLIEHRACDGENPVCPSGKKEDVMYYPAAPPATSEPFGVRLVKGKVYQVESNLVPRWLADSPVVSNEVTQEDITYGCVVVSDIRSHRMGWRVGPGIDATVHNGCDKAITVIADIAYYGADGVQFGSDVEMESMAPLSDLKFQKAPLHSDLAKFYVAKVIKVWARAL